MPVKKLLKPSKTLVTERVRIISQMSANREQTTVVGTMPNSKPMAPDWLRIAVTMMTSRGRIGSRA